MTEYIKKENPQNKGGRPKKEIDMVLAKDLAKIGCTMVEIASALRISHDTLSKNQEFMDMYNNEKTHAGRSVRRRLWDIAMQTDDMKAALSASIWLSKQYLHFSDRVKEDVVLEGGETPIKLEDVRDRIKLYEHIFTETSST